MFSDMELVRESQIELDYVIQESVAAITALLKGHKAARVKAPVIIATEKTYGRRLHKSEVPIAGTFEKLSTEPHRGKLNTELHGAITMNEGSDAIIQMENDVDSHLSDAESQISDRTAAAMDVEELNSDSNVQYDDLKN